MENLEKVIKETEDFFYVDDTEINRLSQELSEHMNNKLYFNPTPLKVNDGVKIDEDYSTKNLRQSFFNRCIFDGANYSNAGLSGSLFGKSQFNECDFLNTNFQACDFRECKFENIKSGLKYTRFSKSIFSDTIFKDCIFNGVIMNDTIFTNCSFLDCSWMPVSIENSIFKNTLLQSVKFKSMNFEFSTFENIKLDNVKLPFPTIPYIFNGLNYLVTTSDNVKITSAKNKDGITIDEYMENLNKLSKFYKYTHNYFPLTNILISQKMFSEAFSSVLNGINLSIELRRFRMLKNYCKQLKYIDNITMHDRKSLYKYILDKISQMNFQDFDYNNLNNYLPEVRYILLDDLKEQKIEVSLSTNIESTDIEKISILLTIIADLLGENCNYSIELRHNSPWDFFIPIFTDPNNISLIINVILLVFSAVQTKIALKQSLKGGEDVQVDYEKIKTYKNKLKEYNIVIMNLTINNNGNIQIKNTK